VISFIKVPSIWAFGALLDTVKRAISGSSGMIVCAAGHSKARFFDEWMQM